MKKSILTLLFLVVITNPLFAQFQNYSAKQSVFFFDAVVFDGPGDSLRVDVYVLVPYETLDFIKNDEMLSAQYTAKVIIKDMNRKKVADTLMQRVIRENDYFVSQGGTGETDHFQVVMNVEPGSYYVEVEIDEPYSQDHHEKKRRIDAIKFSEYDFSLSGILLISSIEEKGSKYMITPHISDNVGLLKDGFFAFFESYNSQGLDKIDFVYEIKKNEELVLRSNRITRDLKEGTQQNFINIQFPNNTGHGNYLLNIYALKSSGNKGLDSADLLAMTNRNITFYRMLSGYLLIDLDKAIKQLKYVATVEELEYISDAKSMEDKQLRFEEFWQKRDPSAKTERNEAFDDYFQRISYADSRFRTSSNREGWNTDKGMVYVIFGEPQTVENSNDQYSGSRRYERWNYRSRRFVFVDNAGFGDWRLNTTISSMDKYEYQKTY